MERHISSSNHTLPGDDYQLPPPPLPQLRLCFDVFLLQRLLLHQKNIIKHLNTCVNIKCFMKRRRRPNQSTCDIMRVCVQLPFCLLISLLISVPPLNFIVTERESFVGWKTSTGFNNQHRSMLQFSMTSRFLLSSANADSSADSCDACASIIGFKHHPWSLETSRVGRGTAESLMQPLVM